MYFFQVLIQHLTVALTILMYQIQEVQGHMSALLMGVGVNSRLVSASVPATVKGLHAN